ncbi:hypothetical protein SGLAM104S_05055 [Streptomyces glaucescens]
MVRVLDAGADKPLDFLTPADEPNPALGVRGLRTLLDHPEVLRTQLTALAKAAEGLPVHLEVMAPMVADRTDALGVRRRVPGGRAAGQVRCDGGDPVGRAAGALDPPGGRVPVAGDERPRAVHLRRRPSGGCCLPSAGPVAAGAASYLVALSAEAARAEGKSCGVCGEAASDPLLACVLTGLGVTSLSMGAASIPVRLGRRRRSTRWRSASGRPRPPVPRTRPRRRAAPLRRCCPASSPAGGEACRATGALHLRVGRPWRVQCWWWWGAGPMSPRSGGAQ